MRWLVGDVQGCIRPLEALLKEIAFDPVRDELWLLGDLVNRGPDSLAVARLWRDLDGRGVIGNHEVYTLCARSGRWPRKPDTVQALYDAPDGEELLVRLRALPALAHLPAVGDGPEAWAVHAGISPLWTDLAATAERLEDLPHDDDWLCSDDVSFATRVRCCNAAGERAKHDGPPAGCPVGFSPWDSFYAGSALIVHGHWAFRGHYRAHNTLGLDSACVHGGSLTAWCQDEDRLVSVPSS